MICTSGFRTDTYRIEHLCFSNARPIRTMLARSIDVLICFDVNNPRDGTDVRPYDHVEKAERKGKMLCLIVDC
jgi:hypothetical protein